MNEGDSGCVCLCGKSDCNLYSSVIENDVLEFYVVAIPDTKVIKETMKLTYKSGSMESYSDACDKKQTFKDRVYRDLHVFHMYEENEDENLVQKMSHGVTREQNM